VIALRPVSVPARWGTTPPTATCEVIPMSGRGKDTEKMRDMTRRMDEEEDGQGAGPDAPETLEPVESPPDRGGPSRWRDTGDDTRRDDA